MDLGRKGGKEVTSTETSGFTDEMKERFLDYLEVNDIYSEESSKRAVNSLKYLSQFMPVERPSKEDVEKYVRFARRKGNINKTIENHLAALIHYNQMMGVEVWTPKLRKELTEQQYVATKEDLENIFKYISSVPSREYSHLLKAIFLTAASTGARIGEIARINTDDLKEDGIYIRAEKREKNRIVGVAPEVLQYLRDYRDHYRLTPTDRTDKGLFVWYHRLGKGRTVTMRYTKDSLRNLIRERARDAGCSNVNSHSLRRFAATELFRSGADFRRVQFHLGHADPKSTMPYVLLIDELEARKNGELLRPFFRRFVEENMRTGHGEINTGSTGMDSHPLLEAEIQCAGSEMKNCTHVDLSKKSEDFPKPVNFGNTQETQSTVPAETITKEVKRVRGHAISEANIARGEGFEPSLSLRNSLAGCRRTAGPSPPRS